MGGVWWPWPRWVPGYLENIPTQLSSLRARAHRDTAPASEKPVGVGVKIKRK